ncbi:hypothetical protein HW132_13920 [Brasilonema sp. CT11]|nr:hypothetical protein [Brasilonema sp. CT11]
MGLYQRVLQAEEVDTQTPQKWRNKGAISGHDGDPITSYLFVATDDSREQTELLLSGLVEKHNGYLRVKNLIYRNIFNTEWLVRQLDNLLA